MRNWQQSVFSYGLLLPPASCFSLIRNLQSAIAGGCDEDAYQ
ncbi:hypothetical protein BH18ACI2_BH18ACI2_01580 [soil metagenome]